MIFRAPSLLIAASTAIATQADSIVSHTLSLGEVLGAFVFIATLVAWLSRKLQKIEDDIEALKDELKTRPCVRDGGKDCPM